MHEDLLTRLNAAAPKLSKGQRRIAAYITAHYDRAAYMTAARLGAEAGVSESTVVRFADELGYSGYPELQRSLGELARTRLTAVQRIEITNDRIGDDDILGSVLSSDAEKIKDTLESIDRRAFDRAVESILSARTIFVVGVRSSSFLAGTLAYNLSLVFDNVRLVNTTSGSEIFEQILRIGTGDVMIAVTFPRYSKRIINAVDYAHSQGARIIAVTDSDTSPIAPKADDLLTARSDMASFVDSLVAPLSIVNALIVAIAKKRKAELSETFGRLERIWDEYDVYAKGDAYTFDGTTHSGDGEKDGSAAASYAPKKAGGKPKAKKS